MSKEQNQDIDVVCEHLRRLSTEQFFGSVTVSFQNGKPGQIRTEQVHKPEELRRKIEGKCARHRQRVGE
jgi:hypothetical protein